MRLRKIVLSLLLLPAVAIHAQEKLIYHPIRTDARGNIVPWYNPDPGTAYNHIMNQVWNFWDTMRRDMNGLPYYMNHQVWNPSFDDRRGIGGDQFAMAISSWRLYYAYTGNERIKENMAFLADYYLTHGLSGANTKWPDLPFPYNTFIYSGYYDGDMRIGPGYLQPDKAGSFALELVHLYKMRENPLYLQAAVRMADVLANHIQDGDSSYSPLPFKVNASTGQIGLIRERNFNGTWLDSAGYTSNWAPTLQLFLDLRALGAGDTTSYRSGFDKLLTWMKMVPMKWDKWGPFFEDVDQWSETQINAMTFARFIMEHRQLFPEWKTQVRAIIEKVHSRFANKNWAKYGVIVTNEQSVYQTPGNSHSARQGADELLYTSLSGDSSYYTNAVRELNWATYAVDFDGRNCFPQDEPWLTDGYGDYIRHFLRAMDAVPALTAAGEDHIISSTSVVQQADYAGNLKKFIYLNFDADSAKVALYYRTFDSTGIEKIRLRKKPSAITLEANTLRETNDGEGYTWIPMKSGGGLLIIRRTQGKKVILMK